MSKAQFGMIGLGTMGRNFLLNVGEQGVAGIGYDRDPAKLTLLAAERQGMDVAGVGTLPEFVAALEFPRRIMLLVPAGEIVDAVIEELLPHLQIGDLVIDAGNSHFSDTERREAFLSAKGILFLGVGVSGGEEGARHGASIMVGGEPAAYELVREIFEAASAKVNGEACAAHVGRGSAGHFVKMVHNGIEYGMMQLIAETFDFMQKVLKMDFSEMGRTFTEWNNGELNSFLIQITGEVLVKTDAESGASLVSVILDTAAQKGTGKWTSQAAMDLGVPIPVIDTAVAMRQISSRKDTRVALAEMFPSDFLDDVTSGVSVDDLRAALLSGFVITYAQGLALLRDASTEKEFDVSLTEIAKIWRGGCIIRSELLETVRVAFTANPALDNLLLDQRFADILIERSKTLRAVVTAFVQNCVPAGCISAALAYFDAMRAERLPANLIQAQRDYFGAHTYQRTDKDGTFHTSDWN
jgi:6-phosphogluconate dehydrogenase